MRNLIYIVGSLVGFAVAAWVVRLLPDEKPTDARPYPRTAEHAEV
jgi:hypothetical protein